MERLPVLCSYPVFFFKSVRSVIFYTAESKIETFFLNTTS